MLDRLLRRIWLLGVPVGLVGAAAVIAYARPWHDAVAPAREVTVEQAILLAQLQILRQMEKARS